MLEFLFTRPKHINTLDARVIGTWAKATIKSCGEGRGNVCLDSFVNTRAGAKGRTPSRALEDVWDGNDSIIVAGGLYPAYHWGRSAWDGGDGPSRAEGIDPPSRPKPPWLIKALGGNVSDFHKLGTILRLSRSEANFVRIALLSFEDAAT